MVSPAELGITECTRANLALMRRALPFLQSCVHMHEWDGKVKNKSALSLNFETLPDSYEEWSRSGWVAQFGSLINHTCQYISRKETFIAFMKNNGVNTNEIDLGALQLADLNVFVVPLDVLTKVCETMVSGIEKYQTTITNYITEHCLQAVEALERALQEAPLILN